MLRCLHFNLIIPECALWVPGKSPMLRVLGNSERLHLSLLVKDLVGFCKDGSESREGNLCIEMLVAARGGR